MVRIRDCEITYFGLKLGESSREWAAHPQKVLGSISSGPKRSH